MGEETTRARVTGAIEEAHASAVTLADVLSAFCASQQEPREETLDRLADMADGIAENLEAALVTVAEAMAE